MSYIGNEPTSVAFLTDTFSGNGSTTAFTLSAAPAGTSSILVSITGVVQDPTTYSTTGTTLTFSAAPPSGTGNISVRFLGIPASGVTTTAYRTVTEFTATAGQTTFSVPSYTPGFIDVYRNGVMLGSADYTASNGLTVVLASGATAGDLVEVISFSVSSVLNAIPATAGSVGTTFLADSSVTKAKMAASGAWAPAGTVLQVVNAVKSDLFSTTSSSYVDVTGYSASITPSSSSSKILVMVNCALSGSSTSEATIAVYRGATLVTNTNITRVASVDYGASITYLDSPATTSPTTYQIKTKANVSTSTINQNSEQDSFITLMEIAG